MGKSTLIKILSGAYKRDNGEILINGKAIDINNPRDAKKYGIETIYQSLAVADNVDAAANLYLGRELARLEAMVPGLATSPLGSLARCCCLTKRFPPLAFVVYH